MNRKDRRKNQQKDHGEFRVPSDPQQEDRFFQHLMVKAAMRENRGEAYGRVEATLTEKDGSVRVGHRTFHVNIRTNTLVVTEDWGGKETARRTLKLDEEPSQQKRGIFAPPARRHEAGPVRPVRRPPDGLATPDAEAVQQAMLQRAETEIVSTGRLPERITLVCDDRRADALGAESRCANTRGPSPKSSIIARGRCPRVVGPAPVA